ncbi:MAG: bifunctional lysine ketoglutarate reductase /saccharopine dehydrogenase family protein [Bacteroidales bacterium]|jgi:alpha-aminoadipic semialdehyde synthase
MKYIGIRNEDKYAAETRSPLTPACVKKIINESGLKFIVQSSEKRIFSDKEFIDAGAFVKTDLKECDVIIGIKEVPLDSLYKDKTYMFFSHIIKGQPHNMPMLKKMMELKCNLIDYEKITDEQGKRLIFFGKYAGLAGMINSLWALGLRLEHLGYKTPFLKIKQAHKYFSLEEAKKEISEVGHEILKDGIPSELKPFVIGITGYGNVSNGAKEICDLLPVKEILPEELENLKAKSKNENIIYKTTFKEEHISRHKEDCSNFDLSDYYKNPYKYHNAFEKYLPHISVLINGMYWDPKFPRIITKNIAGKYFNEGISKLMVIGDITCDIEGSIELTVKATSIDTPLFVYNPKTNEIEMGHKGTGILVMAVDILPSELPRDSSMWFSHVLCNYVKPLAEADFSKTFGKINLPASIKKALILHKGKLTNNYKYIENFIK